MIDMALFDDTQSRSGSRFGQLSSNMFFARNTANPKRVRHIEGIEMFSRKTVVTQEFLFQVLMVH